MNCYNSLLENLTAYSQADYYPFHMPGHKRVSLDIPNPWSVDITEIDGFDNLHHAEGILKDLQTKASELFGAKRSFCLVNGSTCGLLSAVSACVKPGGKLLMSRNCHKSVYHAVYLRNITPVYVMPEMTEFGIMGSLSPAAVESALQEQPDIDAVLVVSPTYDGVVSDIQSIADIAHKYHIPLIVDEAHGAHFPLSDRFPKSALVCGADVVVQSLHKTLPAFTQTALLHLNSDLVEESVIRRFLGIYQSSSPSYLLMASMDKCMQIIETKGRQLFADLHRNLEAFYQKCSGLRYIQIFNPNISPQDVSLECSFIEHAFSVKKENTSAVFDWDESKILISGTGLGLSGQDLYDILRNQYHLQLEMASGHYVLALTSLMDREEGFERLFIALQEIEKKRVCHQKMLAVHSGSASQTDEQMQPPSTDMITAKDLYRIPQRKMTISEALESPSSTILLEDAAGAISQEYLYLYPPGIPLVAPGEIIDTSLLENISRIKQAGLKPEGLSDMTNTRINVVIF